MNIRLCAMRPNFISTQYSLVQSSCYKAKRILVSGLCALKPRSVHNEGGTLGVVFF